MLADEDVCAQQDAVHGAGGAARVVDIVAVDADQRRATCDQQFGGGGGQEGVIREICVRAPVPAPAGIDQHRAAGAFDVGKGIGIHGQPMFRGVAHDEAGQVGDLGEAQGGQVVAMREAVEGRVQIGAGVRYHVDPAHLEGAAVAEIPGGLLARPVIADGGAGQALIGRHPRDDIMAEVDQAAHGLSFPGAREVAIWMRDLDAIGMR